MAFFGLTSAGPQNPFTAFSVDAVDISIFTESDFRRAFTRAAKDDIMDVREAYEMLEELFRGPPPKPEADRLCSALSEFRGVHGEGLATWDEFWGIMKRLQEEREAAATAPKGLPTGRVSAAALHESRRRHIREFSGPRDKLLTPMTLSHDIGWEMRAEDTTKAAKEVKPVKKCEETRFAEQLFASGGFL